MRYVCPKYKAVAAVRKLSKMGSAYQKMANLIQAGHQLLEEKANRMLNVWKPTVDRVKNLCKSMQCRDVRAHLSRVKE